MISVIIRDCRRIQPTNLVFEPLTTDSVHSMPHAVVRVSGRECGARAGFPDSKIDEKLYSSQLLVYLSGKSNFRHFRLILVDFSLNFMVIIFYDLYVIL